MKLEKRPIWTQVVWIILIVIGVGVLGQLAYSSYSLWRKQDIVHEREGYLKTLEQDQITLKNNLTESLQAGYIEQEARNKLGLAKPGETVVIMPEGSGGANLSQESFQPQNETGLPNWKKWLRLFF